MKVLRVGGSYLKSVTDYSLTTSLEEAAKLTRQEVCEAKAALIESGFSGVRVCTKNGIPAGANLIITLLAIALAIFLLRGQIMALYGNITRLQHIGQMSDSYRGWTESIREAKDKTDRVNENLRDVYESVPAIVDEAMKDVPDLHSIIENGE